MRLGTETPVLFLRYGTIQILPAERKLSSSDAGTRSIRVTLGRAEAACISLSLAQPTPSPESRNLMSGLFCKIRAASKTDSGSCVKPALPDIATINRPPHSLRYGFS